MNEYIFETIDAFIDRTRKFSLDSSDEYTCLVIVTYHAPRLLEILQHVDNKPSKYDLMIIKHTNEKLKIDYRTLDYSSLKSKLDSTYKEILEVYKNRKDCEV